MAKLFAVYYINVSKCLDLFFSTYIIYLTNARNIYIYIYIYIYILLERSVESRDWRLHLFEYSSFFRHMRNVLHPMISLNVILVGKKITINVQVKGLLIIISTNHNVRKSFQLFTFIISYICINTYLITESRQRKKPIFYAIYHHDVVSSRFISQSIDALSI